MKKWYQQTDIMLGIGVVSVVAMLVIPIPSFLLDFLLVVSILISLVALLNAMYNQESSEFSVFPTLLLVSTVFRLALNVSSTRLILKDGPAFDAKLIRAFGEFVVGGNYVIGFVIFLILVLVQIMVISKGATRIAEVAARFKLDALPGKQMAIDTDLQSGLITQEEAHARRDSLRREADFFGQMDGATKFVQGDVRVGLIITAINIIGGLIIGVSIRGESFRDALQIYTLLTVGDGLVAQIPSLLITTATGLVVTRAGARDNLSGELSTQLFNSSRIMWITAGTMLFAAILPGFPHITLVFTAVLLGVFAWSISRRELQKVSQEKQKADENVRASAPTERFLDELAVDPLKLEVGYNLLPLVDKAAGGTLLERITNLRQKTAREIGMIVPPIRINDNMDLDPNEYVVLVSGIEVARSQVYPDKYAALAMQGTTEPLQGDPFTEPAFGQKGFLVEHERKKEAEDKGYVVVDASNVIVTHLSEILRTYAPQIMGREELRLLLDKLKQKYPTVVEEALKAVSSQGVVLAVIHNLLKENVAIKNMVTILETLADFGQRVKDAGMLTDLVRQKLSRQIASQYWDNNRILPVILLDPLMESELRNAATYDEREGRIFSLDPHLQIRMTNLLKQTIEDANHDGVFPIILTGSDIRMGVFQMLEKETSSRHFAVLAHEELPPDARLNTDRKVIMETEEMTAK